MPPATPPISRLDRLRSRRAWGRALTWAIAGCSHTAGDASMGENPECGTRPFRVEPGSSPMVTARSGTDDRPMTTEQQTTPRTLRRRSDDRVIGGVASGLGDYLNVDPLLIRIGFVGLMLFGGLGLRLY